jgi:predicted DNA-binding WGR domain protein
MTRRLEHAGRFWQIDRVGAIVQVTWGAIGSPGQRHDRAFDHEADAQAYVEHHLAQYQAKGYVEIVEPAQPAAPEPTSRHVRFEWVAGVDTWFLEIVQTERTVHHRKGRIIDGNDRIDARDTKRFTSREAASALYEEKCAEARYHGAEPIGRGEQRSRAAVREAARVARRSNESAALSPALPDRAGIATHADLEAQCWESPDAPHPWEVYADWLETRNDPRAKIVARDRAGGSVIELVREQLLGIADDDGVEDELRGTSDHEVQLELELRFGFVRHATVSIKPDAGIELDVATRRLLSAPVACFVESLRFGLAHFEGDNDWEPTLRAVVESEQGGRMRSLAFDRYDSTDSELSWVGYGDFSELLPRLPALEVLKIRGGGGGDLGTLAMPAMKTFVRESGGLKRSELAAIGRAKWPNLEHLEIWTGSTDHGAEATLSDLETILEARDLPRLRHLGIVNSELSDELVPALAKSRVLGQLESLDLSRGVGETAFASALVHHAAAFRHLAAFDVSSNLLATDQIARIRGALDNVIVDAQRDSDDERYVEIGE